MYRGRIPCIPIQSSILQYWDICACCRNQVGLSNPAKVPKKIHFFMDQSWNRIGLCITLQKTPNLPSFLGSGLCDPSDLVGEPFCIQEFCFVTYQLIWSYSQKPLTFSSFTASNKYTICFSTLYSLYVWFWLN